MNQSRYFRTRPITRRARTLRRETTKTEARLWLHLRNNQMGASFRRQHPVGNWFADYCCPSLKLIIEIDGPTHSAARDEARDQGLAADGYDVIHFSVQDMDERFESVIDTIHAEVQLRLLRQKSSDTKPSSP